jgi:hypothetical protein
MSKQRAASIANAPDASTKEALRATGALAALLADLGDPRQTRARVSAAALAVMRSRQVVQWGSRLSS